MAYDIGEGHVTHDQFHKGLMALGITCPEGDETFHDFVQKVDVNRDGKISLDEFIHVVQMIKMTHLFKPEANMAVMEASGYTYNHNICVTDYSPTSIHIVSPVKNLMRFMFSDRPAWAKVRWVHVTGIQDPNDLNMRRLAIKYQLHPLALEDCLSGSNSIRCKYEHYEDHTFLVRMQ